MSISRRVDQLVVDENFVECPEDVPVGWNPISETETEAKMNLRFIATFLFRPKHSDVPMKIISDVKIRNFLTRGPKASEFPNQGF